MILHLFFLHYLYIAIAVIGLILNGWFCITDARAGNLKQATIWCICGIVFLLLLVS